MVPGDALEKVQARIDAVFQRLTVRIQAELLLLYWQIGQQLLQFPGLGEDRQQLLELSRLLSREYGKVWNPKQLEYCLRAARTFSAEEIRRALAARVSWSHMRRLVAIADEEKRRFYTDLCGLNGLSVSQLSERMEGGLFERSVSARRPEEMPSRQELEAARSSTPDLLVQDPLLSFLGVQSLSPTEQVEGGLLRAVEKFFLESAGLALIARRRQLPIRHGLFFVDLLLYDRVQSRLVVLLLRVGAAEQDDFDLMDLYLLWLAEKDQLSHEQPPLGILLGVGASIQVELLELQGQQSQRLEVPAHWPCLERIESFLCEAYRQCCMRLGPEPARGSAPTR